MSPEEMSEARMSSAAYYNEIDPYAAQWLRNLISAGHIAPGDVDERSIEDVHPSDLIGYGQCHFFAGIGVWSHALRSAGWRDDRPVWTGSCPCQPFSAAGKGAGFDDERHLWPAFHHLIRECRPAVVFGEQVETAIGNGWVDSVAQDLEALGYAFGAAGLPAGAVGADHKRARLFFVADSHQDSKRRHPRAAHGAQAPLLRSEIAASDGLGFGRPRLLRGSDGLDRRVPESCFPLLVDGSAVGLARIGAFGNAIHAEAARVFIQATMNED